MGSNPTPAVCTIGRLGVRSSGNPSQSHAARPEFCGRSPICRAWAWRSPGRHCSSRHAAGGQCHRRPRAGSALTTRSGGDHADQNRPDGYGGLTGVRDVASGEPGREREVALVLHDAGDVDVIDLEDVSRTTCPLVRTRCNRQGAIAIAFRLAKLDPPAPPGPCGSPCLIRNNPPSSRSPPSSPS